MPAMYTHILGSW